MNFTVTNKLVNSAPSGYGSGYMSVQGGCIVGNDLYSFMLHVDGYNEIFKTDMTTGVTERVAMNLSLGHANDACFNGEDIIVADCGGNDTNVQTLYVVDIETYEVKQTVKLDEKVVSIAYDAINERYVTIGYQNEYFCIYDKDFNLIKQFTGEITSGYAAQGILTDGTYLYMLEYYKENDVIKNNLRVFDLETGDCVKTVDIGIAREAENLFYRNGKFYTTCNDLSWKGFEIYELTFNTVS